MGMEQQNVEALTLQNQMLVKLNNLLMGMEPNTHLSA